MAVLHLDAIERDERDVRAGELAQRRRGPGAIEHGVAHGTAEPLDHGCATEEDAVLGPECRQDLLPQVLADDAVLATEGVERRGGVVLLADRARGQLERRGPARRQRQQPVGLIRGEPQPGAAQQLRSLGSRHGQPAGPQLDDVVLGPEASQGQRRLAARRERERGARRHVRGDPRDDRLGRFGPERLEAVQHEHGRAEGRDDARGVVERGGRRRGGGRRRLDLAQRRGDRAQQASGVVVRLGQRDRGEGPGVPGTPLRQHRALAVPGGRDDDGERPRVLDERRDQTRPLDRAAARTPARRLEDSRLRREPEPRGRVLSLAAGDLRKKGGLEGHGPAPASRRASGRARAHARLRG